MRSRSTTHQLTSHWECGVPAIATRLLAISRVLAIGSSEFASLSLVVDMLKAHYVARAVSGWRPESSRETLQATALVVQKFVLDAVRNPGPCAPRSPHVLPPTRVRLTVRTSSHPTARGDASRRSRPGLELKPRIAAVAQQSCRWAAAFWWWVLRCVVCSVALRFWAFPGRSFSSGHVFFPSLSNSWHWQWRCCTAVKHGQINLHPQMRRFVGTCCRACIREPGWLVGPWTIYAHIRCTRMYPILVWD